MRGSRLTATSCAVVLGLATAVAAAERPITIVACAPGYPGNTDQAQPSMDAFADGVAGAAGWSPGRIRAVYHERLEEGLERLARDDTALAMVPLPFYLEYREQLALEPLLEVVQQSGEDEVWSLVAKRGALGTAGDELGWSIVGLPGYSPRFVRNVALVEWRPLPTDLGIRPTSRVLSVLRQAAAGEPVAVLLDRAQTAALSSLPFGDELEIVTRSGRLPASLLCRVDGRLGADDAEVITHALLGLHDRASGQELLETLRVVRFRRTRDGLLQRLEQAFARAPRATP